MGQFIIPANAVSHFHLHAGDRAADLGAGSGHFVFAMAREVGHEGRVFAVEIQKELVQRIAREARDRKLTNVEVLWGDLEHSRGLRFSDGTLDAAVLSNTLFQIKNKPAALAEARRILRAGGKFFLIDWTDSWGGMGPHPDDVIKEQEAKALVEQAGFTYERSFPAGDHHYGLAFRK